MKNLVKIEYVNKIQSKPKIDNIEVEIIIIRKKLISMSIISTSLTVPGQPSPRFQVEAWLPYRNCEMDYLVTLKYNNIETHHDCSTDARVALNWISQPILRLEKVKPKTATEF